MPARLSRFLALTLALATATAAQPARTVPLGDPAYVLVERLQRRGLLLELHPTALPYTEAALAAALDRLPDDLGPRAARWAADLRDRPGTATPEPGRVGVSGHLGVGADASTSARLDPLRPTVADRTLTLGDGALYPEAHAHIAFGAGPFVAQAGARHSVYANDDPDGFDLALRLMLRPEEVYVAARWPLGAVALGRVATHWGPHGRDALVVSGNPRPYDALHARIGGSRLALRSVLGQLDSALPDGTFSETLGQRPGDRPSAEPRIDRFFAAHRIDWRPSRHVALTVLESALYSGANADLSLAYLLPSQPFVLLIDNTPKNVENNGAVGAMAWGHWRRWTAHAELYIDDLDVLNGTEPVAGAATVSLVRAEALPGVDAVVGATAVAARAYAAPQPEGAMLYALRGLAQEFNDYVRLDARAEWFATPDLMLAPGAQVLWQGEGAIEAPYPTNATRSILTGAVARTVRLGLGARYQRGARLWASADLGVNWTDGAAPDGFQAVAGVGLRLGRAATLRPDL